MKISYKQWFIIALVDFLIVAIYGALMRYKFLVPIPWLDHKNLLHAHSHFAFTAWVSMTLMILLPMMLNSQRATDSVPKPYSILLYLNLLTSVGMLVAFTLQGYALFSIILSSCSLLVSFAFIRKFWKDLKAAALRPTIKHWYYISLICSAVSALGTFYLIYLKASHQDDPLQQQAAIYFYLHFQYNGWFFFACLALFYHFLGNLKPQFSIPTAVQYIFSATLIPTYFLTIVWWKGFPEILSYLLILTVVTQVCCWLYVWKNSIAVLKVLAGIPTTLVSVLWIAVAIGVSLKFLLQGCSIIPALSSLVYGFRPMAIAYLHLVLLVNISLFLIGFAFQHEFLRTTRLAFIAILALLIGVCLNEVLLGLQGIGGWLHWNFKYSHEFLFLASVLISISIFLLLISQCFKSQPNADGVK